MTPVSCPEICGPAELTPEITSGDEFIAATLQKFSPAASVAEITKRAVPKPEQPSSFDSAEHEPRHLLGQEAESEPEATACKEGGAELEAPTSLFRKEGQFWTIAYGGSLVRLRDTKGLQYLAHLLGHPNQEFLALDLAADFRVRKAEGGNAGPAQWAITALDPKAQTDYRNRLQDLREQLAEAEAHNDVGRLESARQEIEFIRHELAAAVGLGGRERAVGSDAERARSTVTKGIKTAVATIRDAGNPAAARHLARTIRTGTFCVYLPEAEERVDWRL